MRLSFVLFFLALNALAAPAKKDSVNGISYSEFKDYDKKMKLTTFTYRRDMNELRIVYADAAAAKALEEGKPYPENSTFFKVVYTAYADPSYRDSLAPDRVSRYQIMRKNQKSPTGGWTYALFQNDGYSYEKNPAEMAIACHSCHELVEDRRFIFSGPLSSTKSTHLANPSKALAYEKIPRTRLLKDVQDKLPAKFKELNLVKNSLILSDFSGTFFEIRSTLGRESLKSKIPVALINDRRETALVIYKADKEVKKVCPDEFTHLKMILRRSEPLNQKQVLAPHVEASDYCYRN